MNCIFKYGSIDAIPLYNCSAHTPEEWSARDGVRRPFAGIIDITYGIIMNILYIPIIAVMFEKKNFKTSCFKIMIFLGMVDMLAIWLNSIITGWLVYQGAVYCSYPNAIYIFGMFGLFLWCCSCMTAMSLALNRLLDLTKESFCKLIFEGNKTYLVLSISIFYGLFFVIFTPSVAFSSKYHAWFFDPLIFENKTQEYTNIPHSINNLLVVAITCLLYVFVCCALKENIKNIKNPMKSQNINTQIFFQSALICAVNQIASIVYVFMNFIDVPVWLVMLGHMLWQCGHGAPVFIYILLNRTIRNGLMKRFGLRVDQGILAKPLDYHV